MTDEEFQTRYHDWQTTDRDLAVREAASVQLTGDRHPTVVGLPFGTTLIYCLMLPSAATLLGELFPETRP